MTENEAKAIKWMKNVRDDAVVTLDHIEKNEPNVSPMLYKGRKEKAEIIIKGFEELEQYRSIGTVSECREAVEKQKAKKPIDGKMRKCVGYYQCPICGGLLTTNKGFCEDCGQAIDFSKESLKITRHVKQ